MKLSLLFVLALSGSIGLSLGQTNLPLLTSETCASKSNLIDCGTNNVVVIAEAFHGRRAVDQGQCEYTNGDCTQRASTNCIAATQTCATLLTSNVKLSNCGNQVAQYLTKRFYCPPITGPTKYDVCSTSVITATSGIITSPEYPNYRQTPQPCQVRLEAPAGKTFNIYVSDINIKARNKEEECDDYLKITDTTGEKIVCSNEREPFAEKFCSNVIYVSYSALATKILIYKGFNLYFEVKDGSPGSGCPTGTPAPPDGLTTTAAPVLPPTGPVVASQFVSFQVCKGNQRILTASDHTLIYIESLDYRVQTIQIGCTPSGLFDCTSPYPLDCNMRKQCTISLFTDQTVAGCSNKKADSLTGFYRSIPIDSTVKYYTCSTTSINTNTITEGVIYSRNFPNFETNQNCDITITNSNSNKAIRVYITDIDIENSCTNNYVQLDDGVGEVSKWCGVIDPTKTYHYQACSNNVKLSYRTGNSNSDYRGFRAYYEVVDLPDSCKPSTPKPSTTGLPPATTTPPVEDVLSPIKTTGGNANGAPCYFPFLFNSVSTETCQAENDKWWCSTTQNYDQDKIRGDCQRGVTENRYFKVCNRKFRTFSCPKNYVINLLSVEGMKTSDGSCDEAKPQCVQSLYAELQILAAGKQSYKVAATFTMKDCGNAQVDVLLIDYICLPDSAPYLTTTNVCTNTATSEEAGIITSPNYPTTQTNVNCGDFTINTPQGAQKIFNLYSIESALHTPANNIECSESYIQVNGGERICGNRKTQLVYSKCGTSFKLNYFVGAKAYKGFKFFYELSDVINPLQCVEPTEAPVDPTATTTKGVTPIWVTQNIASGSTIYNHCKLSGSITCPENYIISIRNYFYGASTKNNCFYTAGDCIAFLDNLKCSGQRSCTLPTYFQFLPNCALFSTYIEIDYECIPTNVERSDICSQSQFTNTKGIITTPNYPIYVPSRNCNTKIVTPSSSTVVKAFIVDMSINNDCSKDSVSFYEPLGTRSTYCGSLQGFFAYETCSSEMDINVITGSTADNTLQGVSIYYEIVPKPDICYPFTTTVTTTPTTRTTTTRSTTTPTTTVRPGYDGLASPITRLVSCGSERISCPNGYIIIVRSASYGVKSSSTPGCLYDPTDCFSPYDAITTTCSGRTTCDIVFVSIFKIPQCGNKNPNYYYTDWECVPVQNAGKPPSSQNYQFCSNQASQEVVQPTSSIIIESERYPKYPSSSVDCIRNITVPSNDRSIDVYLTGAGFPGSGTAACETLSDYLRLNDGLQTVSFCRTGVLSQYVFRTRSNWVTVEFKANGVANPSSAQKGFQLYFEAKPAIEYSTYFTREPTTIPITQPITIGQVSEEYSINLCVDDRRELSCPTDYIIIVIDESLIFSRTSCTYTPGACRETTFIVSNECNGRDGCQTALGLQPMSFCNSQYADGLDFTFQCVPAGPIESIVSYPVNGPNVTNIKNGYVTSPGYPTFTYGISNINFWLTPPAGYEYRVYVVDIAMSTDCVKNTFSIEYETSLCQGDPLNLYARSAEPILITYKSPLADQINTTLEDVSSFRGFKLYFEAFPVQQATTTPRPTTVDNLKRTTVVGVASNTALYVLSFGVCLPLVIIVVLVVLFMNKLAKINVSEQFSKIKFSNNDSSLNEDIKSFSNPVADYNDK